MARKWPKITISTHPIVPRRPLLGLPEWRRGCPVQAKAAMSHVPAARLPDRGTDLRGRLPRRAQSASALVRRWAEARRPPRTSGPRDDRGMIVAVAIVAVMIVAAG